MAIAVEMPKPGNTVEECLVAKWLKRAGSRVTAGEVVAEIETDKATFEVPSPADGVLLATFYDEGALVPVYTNLFVIGEPGEDIAALAPASGAAPASDGRGSDSPVPPSSPATVVEQRALSETGSAAASPRARRYAAEHGIRTDGIRGSGPGGRILEQDVRDFYHASPKQSFAARARAAEGFEAPAAGSGLHGMILADDLAEVGTPLGRMREKIAQRMRESLSQTAQYTLIASANASGLLALRSRIKSARQESGLPDININELVLFCTVQALLKTPALNAEFGTGNCTGIRKSILVSPATPNADCWCR